MGGSTLLYLVVALVWQLVLSVSFVCLLAVFALFWVVVETARRIGRGGGGTREERPSRIE